MAEKVIFEFHADQVESDCGFGFGHRMNGLFGRSDLDCCRMMGIHGTSCGEEPEQSDYRDQAHHHMRETLDLFERIYEDLFGREESDTSKEQVPD